MRFSLAWFTAISSLALCSGCSTSNDPGFEGSGVPAEGGAATGDGGGTADGAAAADGGKAGTTGKVNCDTAECTLGSQICCSPSELGGPYTCAASGMTTCGQTIQCDGPEDCSTGPCCTYYAQPGKFYAACWPQKETGCIRACHIDADCPATATHCCDLGGRPPLRWCSANPCQ